MLCVPHRLKVSRLARFINTTAEKLGNNLEFDHLHYYVRRLEPLETYQAIEKNMQVLGQIVEKQKWDVATSRGHWESSASENLKDPTKYKSTKQDIVKQMLWGFGWRITGFHDGPNSTSVRIQSPAANGVKYIVTAPSGAGRSNGFSHFDKTNVERYVKNQGCSQGCGVLGFQAPKGDVVKILAQYKASHPYLVKEFSTHGDANMLEVFAYPLPDGSGPDTGTVLRFMEGTDVPGLVPVEAECPPFAMEAYNDHWVSNVIDRERFLGVMNDVLGFSPKVDFNAGVVGAGDAVIESTVTGNAPNARLRAEEVLENQQQIYLPVNNALSPFGHVHNYLDQRGQGIQHTAARVTDLPLFVEKVNKMREITGEGFSFLKIPPTYYGRLSKSNLQDAQLPDQVADHVLQALKEASLVSYVGCVNFDVTDEHITNAVASVSGVEAHTESIIQVVKQARYNTLYRLLQDNLSEEEYLRIVKNQVLVDIQGRDVLFQIFTKSILQDASEECPFIEFIERRCLGASSEEAEFSTPGCGGFGIRNFIALFLSIEVTNASEVAREARQAGDRFRASVADSIVDLFEEQLHRSDPVLTGMAMDMMTEADAMAELEVATSKKDRLAAQTKLEQAITSKNLGSEKMVELGEHYQKRIKVLRSQLSPSWPSDSPKHTTA